MQLNKEVPKTFYESKIFGILLFCSFGFAHLFAASYIFAVPAILIDNLDPVSFAEFDKLKITGNSFDAYSSTLLYYSY